MPGRFSIADELANIHDGMHQDLQMPVGQWVQWWVFDEAQTTTDDIYDVATYANPDGRYWKRPIEVPCLSAQVYQGQTYQDERGFYNIDSLHLTIDMKTVWRLLPSLPQGSDSHLKDRVVFRGQAYSPHQVWSRGQVHNTYTVLSVDLLQVKSDEMVNDPQFAASLSDQVGTGGQELQGPKPGVYDATYEAP